MVSKFSAVAVAVLLAGSAACATKTFVRNNVKDVNDKVDSIGRSVEETQERTRKHEGTIGQVDQKAQAAQSSADSARQAASDAATEANAARARASEVGSQADDFDRAYKRLVYTVVLSEDEGQFASGKTVLPDEAKAKLDELVTKLKADPNGAFFEIEGHTDALGPKAVQRENRPRSRRGREAVSVRTAPDPAAPHQRDQLWHGQAGGVEQDARGPRPQSPGRDSRPGLAFLSERRTSNVARGNAENEPRRAFDVPRSTLRSFPPIVPRSKNTLD